jgi:hypothetical protein
LWQKKQTLLPCQLRFVKLSFVRITPLCMYHVKIFIFKGAFNFPDACLGWGYQYESFPSNEISLRNVHLDVGSIETHQVSNLAQCQQDVEPDGSMLLTCSL